jgi:hypothetical protein
VSVVQALERNVGTCGPMQREQAKWWTDKAKSTKAGRGTEQPVVAMKLPKSTRSEGVASFSFGHGSTV